MTATITLTVPTDDIPAPRIIVTVDSLDAGVASLTLTRTMRGRTFKVRGAVNVPVSSGFSIPDIEAGFGVPATYRAQLFDASGADLGYTVTASTTLERSASWIHNPLDPFGAAQIDVDDGTGRNLTRTSDGEVLYPQNRTLGVLLAGPRHGLTGVDLFLSTTSKDGADAFQAMLGGYDITDQPTPTLCVRTPPQYSRLPPTFFAAVLSMTEKPITVHMGGELIEFEGSADEVAPPYPGIIVPLLTRDDVDAFYSTRDLLDAAYARRIDIDRDYSLVGTA
ncbi:MAG: hypothetical protein KF861_00290 [Planctomycetaceae bacterium]|nr:hypothetical protein [Planctomycetaceae bacterium]